MVLRKADQWQGVWPRDIGVRPRELAALRESKNQGLKTLAIVNVVGSSIAREADYVCYTLAGPEISVATTKAYSAQLIVSYLLGIKFVLVRGIIDNDRYQAYLSEIESIPDKIEQIIEDKERIQWFASKFANARDVFFVCERGLTPGTFKTKTTLALIVPMWSVFYFLSFCSSFCSLVMRAIPLLCLIFQHRLPPIWKI